MSAFIDRAAVESGNETDVEQSDDEALHVDGYDVGDGFVVGGGEESDATELAEARASLRSVATDSEFAQDLRGRRQAELEEEMRLLARDRGVQIVRRRKRLKNRPAVAAQSDVASAARRLPLQLRRGGGRRRGGRAEGAEAAAARDEA